MPIHGALPRAMNRTPFAGLLECCRFRRALAACCRFGDFGFLGGFCAGFFAGFGGGFGAFCAFFFCLFGGRGDYYCGLVVPIYLALLRQYVFCFRLRQRFKDALAQ